MNKYLGTSKKQKHKKRHDNPARADRSSQRTRRAYCGPSGARWVGEHLGCSPCGELAGRALCVARLAGSGGAAVALAASNPTLYRCQQIFKGSWCCALQGLLAPAQLHEPVDASQGRSAAASRPSAISSATVSRWIRQHRALQVAHLAASSTSSGPADGCMLSSLDQPGGQGLEWLAGQPQLQGGPGLGRRGRGSRLSIQANRSPSGAGSSHSSVVVCVR